MTIFLSAIGGIAFFLLVWIFLMVAKNANDTAKNTQALKLVLSRLQKLEQISIATMGAAENFVDALRESNEDGPPLVSPSDMNFDDLRETFENGIRKFEEESDDDEGEGWKKKD